jgi:hypothetical protein
MREDGDKQGEAVWIAVLRALVSMIATKPPPGQSVH